MKVSMTKLEFWTDGTNILRQHVIVPTGYSIPRAGEMIILPEGSAASKWRCEAVAHQFNYIEESSVDDEACMLFIVRILVSKL